MILVDISSGQRGREREREGERGRERERKRERGREGDGCRSVSCKRAASWDRRKVGGFEGRFGEINTPCRVV